MKSLIVITIVSTLAILPKESLGYSNCAEARENAIGRNDPYIIHECDENGDYLPLQKTVGTPHWYWCFDKQGGVLLGPSKNIRSCTCPVKKKEAMDEGRRFLGSCDGAGYFVIIQSNRTHHCCVNKETGAIRVDWVPVTTRIDCPTD